MKRIISLALAAVLLLGSLTMLSSCSFLRLLLSEDDEGETEYGKSNGYADGFLYEEWDGGCRITGLADSGSDIIVLEIPEEIDGRTVVAIAPEAFKDNGRIELLKLPQSVNEIGERAFYSCEALREVTFPEDGVEDIGAEAFAECTSLDTVILPSCLETVGAGAFRGCSQLLAISIPGSVSIVHWSSSR